jgi:hypothetical protein
MFSQRLSYLTSTWIVDADECAFEFIAHRVRPAVFQQHPSSPEQLQLGSVPVSRPMITAAAHPTPASTVMAVAGQFFAHAPHSIQLSLSSIAAFFSFTLKTP